MLIILLGVLASLCNMGVFCTLGMCSLAAACRVLGPSREGYLEKSPEVAFSDVSWWDGVGWEIFPEDKTQTVAADTPVLMCS